MMHKKMCDRLTLINSQLNPKTFQGLYKQIHFALAESHRIVRAPSQTLNPKP